MREPGIQIGVLVATLWSAAKLATRSGIPCTADDVLLTSGSLQGMDLVNGVLVGPGDTVILEEFTYGGAITKIQRLGAKVVAALTTPAKKAITVRFTVK